MKNERLAHMAVEVVEHTGINHLLRSASIDGVVHIGEEQHVTPAACTLHATHIFNRVGEMHVVVGGARHDKKRTLHFGLHKRTPKAGRFPFSGNLPAFC